jgi:hypothetical protein
MATCSQTIEVRLRRRWLLRLAGITGSERLARFALIHAYGEWRRCSIYSKGQWHRMELADALRLR